MSTYVLDLLSPADAAAFVAEARRVLRPGGVLALASLAPGRTPPARLVTRLWQRGLAPEPRAARRLPPARRSAASSTPDDWAVRADFPVTDWFLSSDVLVARAALSACSGLVRATAR